MKQGNINMKMPFLHCIMIYTGRNYDEKKKTTLCAHEPIQVRETYSTSFMYWGKCMVVTAHEMNI